ncbi:hypothetical protein BU16DRAFT_554056 [Lophium mytilinum]|uniref:Uncharacterized protein n=1 Tax=Lophium mytilinum TaxID=390894 RepID=A0A6A6RC02_9PEZI|nr:hypothetical protein BU16DRAFT_554056 [Lophium mytilinum]
MAPGKENVQQGATSKSAPTLLAPRRRMLLQDISARFGIFADTASITPPPSTTRPSRPRSAGGSLFVSADAAAPQRDSASPETGSAQSPTPTGAPGTIDNAVASDSSASESISAVPSSSAEQGNEELFTADVADEEGTPGEGVDEDDWVDDDSLYGD